MLGGHLSTELSFCRGLGASGQSIFASCSLLCPLLLAPRQWTAILARCSARLGGSVRSATRADKCASVSDALPRSEEARLVREILVLLSGETKRNARKNYLLVLACWLSGTRRCAPSIVLFSLKLQQTSQDASVESRGRSAESCTGPGGFCRRRHLLCWPATCRAQPAYGQVWLLECFSFPT